MAAHVLASIRRHHERRPSTLEISPVPRREDKGMLLDDLGTFASASPRPLPCIAPRRAVRLRAPPGAPAAVRPHAPHRAPGAGAHAGVVRLASGVSFESSPA